MTKKRWIITALALVLACALAAALIPRGGSTGVFYRVHGGQSDMYLLGSIHAGSHEMYPMQKAIRIALKEADVLVFECDTESAQAVAATQRLMYHALGESLRDSISEACWENVEQAAMQLGYDTGMLNAMKPWAVVSLLSVESMADSTGSTSREATELGVEKQVRRLAKDKPVQYLETAEEQLLLMDGFSPELQEYLLWDACEAVLNPAESSDIAQWPKWWRDGNAQAFANSYHQEMAAEPNPALAQEYHEALITTRNQTMANKLAEMLESNQTAFVTVGLMHLVLEDDSILTELTNKGYTIEPLLRP